MTQLAANSEFKLIDYIEMDIRNPNNLSPFFQLTDDKLFEQGINQGINFDKFDNIKVMILELVKSLISSFC